MSGRRIADNWRAFDPLQAIDLNWPALVRLPVAELLLIYRRIKKNVFRPWGLDWDAIRASDRDAGFNVYDFTEQRVVVVPPSGMSEDMLAAAGALPVFFPPVEIGGHVYVDAVQGGAANREHAIARGADQLWIVWTTSTAGRWRNGPLGEYFGIFDGRGAAALPVQLQRPALPGTGGRRRPGRARVVPGAGAAPRRRARQPMSSSACIVSARTSASSAGSSVRRRP